MLLSKLSAALSILAAVQALPDLPDFLKGVQPVDMVEAYKKLKETKGEPISYDEERKLWYAHQYAAAAYCDVNYGHTTENLKGNPIQCHTPACIGLANDKTEILDRFHHLGEADSTGFVAFDHVRRKIVVAFRGSVTPKNDFADAEFELRPAPEICGNCNVVRGFDIFWQEAKRPVIDAVKRAIQKHPKYQLEVIGHSLGAAAATICAGHFRNTGWVTDLYAFSSPRVGDDAFARHISEGRPQHGTNYRVTHSDDWVPKVPPWPVYQHIKNEYYIEQMKKLPITEKDIRLFKGYQYKDFLGGNGATKGADVTFRAHSWLWDNITECSPSVWEAAKRAPIDIPTGYSNDGCTEPSCLKKGPSWDSVCSACASARKQEFFNDPHFKPIAPDWAKKNGPDVEVGSFWTHENKDGKIINP